MSTSSTEMTVQMSPVDLPRFRDVSLRRSPLVAAWVRQYQVIYAIMLQDIKSRYFGNGLGYAVTIIWPATHVVVLLLIYHFVHKAAPYGDSPLLYAATGVAPYIAWSYISRFMCLGVVQNKSFLSYTIIKPLDTLFARMFLEFISSYIVTAGIIIALAICQSHPMPLDPAAAAAGMLSAVALGAGFGMFNAVICMVIPLWQVGYVLILVVCWITCGLAINPEALPERAGKWLAYNPLLHCVEWIRSAYYPDFPAHLLDKSYVLWCAAIPFVLGLVMVRFLRRFMV